MNPRLRRLLEPAPTSPTDSFTWHDKRSKTEQLVNGVRIAGGLIAGLVVIASVTGCLGALSEDQPRRSTGTVFEFVIALAVAAIVMFLTANRWAPFVTGFFFGPALLKIAAVLALQSNSYYSSHSMSRTGMAEFLAYSVAVVALTFRFVGERPAQTTIVDRFALTFFALTCLKQLTIEYSFPAWPLLCGSLALFAAWCAHHVRHVQHKPRHHSHHRETPVTPAKS